MAISPDQIITEQTRAAARAAASRAIASAPRENANDIVDALIGLSEVYMASANVRMMQQRHTSAERYARMVEELAIIIGGVASIVLDQDEERED